ncbi:unnamed protein product [Prorocentrum cordatum]|uniref:Uncharacterized protein n=1 Tax=Prorocentrum cordatum TaxID=2364126 RepID=A0ABN9W4V0_9DINO|nr:unnamed protein product [Polarella glacialis]
MTAPPPRDLLSAAMDPLPPQCVGVFITAHCGYDLQSCVHMAIDGLSSVHGITAADGDVEFIRRSTIRVRICSSARRGSTMRSPHFLRSTHCAGSRAKQSRTCLESGTRTVHAGGLSSNGLPASTQHCLEEGVSGMGCQLPSVPMRRSGARLLACLHPRVRLLLSPCPAVETGSSACCEPRGVESFPAPGPLDF